MTAPGHEDEWQRRATGAAIQCAKDLIGEPTKLPKSTILGCDGAIPAGVPIGKLSDIEWGWIFAAIVFGWISTRATQAAAEGWDTEEAIRRTGLAVEPWEAGVIGSIFPQLVDDPRFDWSKSLNDWSRVEMIEFLHTTFGLIQKAMIARDCGGTITRKRHDANHSGNSGDGRQDSGESFEALSGD
jgi:hypothetical protein